MSGFNLDDYVTVAERVAEFYGRFPEGSLQAEVFELSESRVVVRAYAYRNPDDPRPSIAHSALAIPGKTPYTKDSEIENAETSAVGRAIALLGFGVKKSLGSRDEIEAKSGEVKGIAPASDGALIGIARTGDKQSSDGELRQTPGGWRLGFRLESREGDRGGILVEVNDDLALQMFSVRDDWRDQPVTCWGSIEDREFQNRARRTIKFQALVLSRIKTPTFELPTTSASAAAVPAPEARRPDDASSPDAAGASSVEPAAVPPGSTSSESDEGASDVPAQTPEATQGVDETAEGAPTAAEAGARASAVCGNKGSMDTVCTLPKGHEGKHRELAVDGRVLASW